MRTQCLYRLCCVRKRPACSSYTAAVENQEQVEQIMLHVSQRESKILLVVVYPCVPVSVCLSLSLYISRYCAERVAACCMERYEVAVGTENMKYLNSLDV